MTDAEADARARDVHGTRRVGRRQGADAAPVRARHVVLVHGAYADGSSWAKVIDPPADGGMNVTAVQNPLTSLADDVAATNFALARQDGPTILVAHSYGGTVISQAGLAPNVAGARVRRRPGPGSG